MGGGYTNVNRVEKNIFGEDSFSFENEPCSFYQGGGNSVAAQGLTYVFSGGHQLSPRYYNALISGLSNSEVAAIIHRFIDVSRRKSSTL